MAASFNVFSPDASGSSASVKPIDASLRTALMAHDWEDAWVLALEKAGIHSFELFKGLGSDQQSAVANLQAVAVPVAQRPTDPIKKVVFEARLWAGWSAAAKFPSSAPLDPAADLTLSSTERSALDAGFRALYRQRLPNPFRAHDSVVARLLLEARSRSMEAFKLSKFRFATDSGPRTSALKISADGASLVQTTAENSIEGFRSFYVTLRALLFTYAYIGSFSFTSSSASAVASQWCSLDAVYDYLLFVESRIFDSHGQLTVAAAHAAAAAEGL